MSSAAANGRPGRPLPPSTPVYAISPLAPYSESISYAGSSDRSDVNNLIITPTFTLNLEKGWFVGLSDYDWTFDWEDGGAATVPIGLQVGRVLHLGRQPVSMSVEAGGNVAQPGVGRRPAGFSGSSSVRSSTSTSVLAKRSSAPREKRA